MEIEAGVNGRRAVKGDDNKGIFDSSEDSVHRSLSPQITTEAGLPGACSPPPWRHAVVLSNGGTHTRGRHPQKPMVPRTVGWWYWEGGRASVYILCKGSVCFQGKSTASFSGLGVP